VSQRWARIFLRLVGILAVVLAVAGLLYTADSLYRVVSGAIDQLVKESGAPHVYASFYVMASICVIFYLSRGSGRAEVGSLSPQDVNAGDVVLIPPSCRSSNHSTLDRSMNSPRRPR
jgi:hypothetical protein